VDHFGFSVGFRSLQSFGFSLSGFGSVFNAPRGAASKRSWASLSGYSSLGLFVMANQNAKLGSIVGGDAKFTVHSELPTDHSFYALVGRVASEWAHLEHSLDIIIWRLTRLDEPIGAALTSQLMGPTPRYNAIGSLLAAHGLDKLVEKITKLKNKTYDLADRRNRIIHDPWYLELMTAQASQFRAMPIKDPRFGFVDIEESQIDDLLKDIQTRRHEVTLFWNELLKALP
jgi:hypothetical protein